jgi:probable rRNA maturation factor
MPISITNRQKNRKIDLSRVRRSLARLLKKLNCEDAEISLLLVDDEQIRKVNRKYLKRDCPTNVISFAMAEGEFGHINPHTLGDIIISAETAFRDAADGKIDFMDEIEFLLIHGLLHLLGYNHEETSKEETEKMKARERELFHLLRHYRIV